MKILQCESKANNNEDVTATHLFFNHYAMMIKSLLVSHSVALPRPELKQ